MVKIFPSLMAADQTNLQHTIAQLSDHCDGFHLDVMDGHFVPNLAFSYDAVNEIARITKLPLFVHLMVEDLEQAMRSLQLPPQTIVSFHPEVTDDPASVAHTMKKRSWVASIAHTPGNSTAELYPALSWASHLLIMGVQPGFSGQAILPESLAVLDEIYGYKKTHNLNLTLAMDGGITPENIKNLALRGVEQFCIGSAIFGASDPVTALQGLYTRFK
jgi:ribulose-phosphate 3-epimerase